MNYTMYAKFYRTVKEQGIEAAADYAHDHGFTSVEFFEFIGKDWTPILKNAEEATRMRYALAVRGIGVACLSVAVNLYEPGMTPDTVTDAEKQLIHYAKMAAALGSPYLHHTLLLGLPRSEELSLEEAVSLIVPAVARIARKAYAHGVRCIYEDQGEYFNGVEGFGAFYREIKALCPWVGVCGDVGNTLFVDEDPVAFFRAYAGEMLHVHIKDYVKSNHPDGTEGWNRSMGGTYLKECVVGEGCIDLSACLDALTLAGYRGAFALENNHASDFADGCRVAMEYIDTRYHLGG